MDDMEEDEIEALLERTSDVVSAIDSDGDGCVDLEELTSFFATMSIASGNSEEDPEEEAEAVIDGMGDGESIDLEALTDLLCETFAEDLDLLGEIEELLRAQDEEGQEERQEKLAAAWAREADSSADEGEGEDEEDESEGEGEEGDGSASPQSSDIEEEEEEEEEDVDDMETLRALSVTVSAAEAACDTEHEARDHALRSFFVSIRLTLKRRRRRLLREVQQTGAENRSKVDELLAEVATDVASGQRMLEQQGDGGPADDDEGAELEEQVRTFVRKPARIPDARCVQFVPPGDARASLQGLGGLETSWHLCLDSIAASSAAGAVDNGAVSLLVAAMEMVGKLPAGVNPLAAGTVEQLCHVMSEFEAEEVDKEKHPRLLPVFAKALSVIAKQSPEHAALVGSEDTLAVVLDWLTTEIADDDVTMPLYDLLAVLCANPALEVLDLFLTEFDGVALCMRAMAPGKKVECMTAAVTLISVMAGSSLEEGEGTVEELVVENVLECDDGIVKILAAMSAVSDPEFHAAACKVFVLLAKQGGVDGEGDTPVSGVFATEHSVDAVAVILTHVLAADSPSTVSVQQAGELLATLLDSPASKKSTARTLETKGLSLLKTILESEEFAQEVDLQRLYVSILAKMAVMNDIKLAMMRAGLVETVCTTLRTHGSSVDCAISCADALCAISKQQDDVKKYIAKRLKTLNPLELLTEALRHFADNEALAKAAATALWSIAYKNVALKASAGKCGAFILLCSAARMHRGKPAVLPHIFIALANLCANHAQNQVEAGRSEVMTICVEFLSGYMKSPNLCFAILNCLNSLISGELDGQDANQAAFVTAGGKEVLEECIEEHAGQEKVKDLAEMIQESLEEGEEAAEGALKKSQAEQGLTALEAQELALCQPQSAWTRLDKHERTQPVRRTKTQLRVKHKKGRPTTPQSVILYKHTLVFLEKKDEKKKKKQQIVDQYSLPLMSTAAIEKDVVTFSARTDAGVEMEEVRMTCDGVADAKEWLAAIKELLPVKTGTLECCTASTFESYKQRGTDKKKKTKANATLKLDSRFASWQAGVLFLFNLSNAKNSK